MAAGCPRGWHHGRLSDSKYSLVMPLLSVPVLALGHVVESPTWWAARFNVIVVAAGVAVSCWLLRGRTDLISCPALTTRLPYSASARGIRARCFLRDAGALPCQ